MTDLRSRINDDINDYVELCRYYNEKPVRDEIGPDPYSSHSHKLQKRHLRDFSRCVEGRKKKTITKRR